MQKEMAQNQLIVNKDNQHFIIQMVLFLCIFERSLISASNQFLRGSFLKRQKHIFVQKIEEFSFKALQK